MQPSVWFWIVGVIALLFNSFGAFDYVQTVTGGDAYLESGGFTKEQIVYWNDMAGWRVALWATGVWSGILGAILLLLRKGPAVPLLAIGPVMFVLNLLATFTDGGMSVLGAGYYVSSVVILGILSFFWWYAQKQKSRGIISRAALSAATTQA